MKCPFCKTGDTKPDKWGYDVCQNPECGLKTSAIYNNKVDEQARDMQVREHLRKEKKQ